MQTSRYATETKTNSKVTINAAHHNDAFARYTMSQLELRYFTRGGTRRTYIENAEKVAGELRIPTRHILFRLSDCLGTMYKKDESGYYLCAHFSVESMSAAVKKYLEMFVICHKCGAAELSADGLTKEKIKLRCDACGVGRVQILLDGEYTRFQD